MINRKEIKNNAKEKIKGHLWELLTPLLIISVINGICNSAFTPVIDTSNVTDYSSLMNEIITVYSTSTGNFLSTIISLVLNIFTVTYVAYLFEFIRTGKASLNTMWESFKKNWLRIFVVSLLSEIFIFLWGLLFIIPGIIAAMGYAMTSYILMDEDEISGIDVLKKSKLMMKGHKWEYFVFQLSFIGWYLLIPFTLGFILIFLEPYQNVACALYYEKLKEITK